MAVGLLVLAACGTGSEVEPGPITSFEDIAGTTYENQGPGTQWYYQFSEDGTWHGSSNRDLLEDRPRVIDETRFEGTKLFLKETKGFCDDDPEAIYEIHLLENDNLRFVEIEDTCEIRSSFFLLAEWAPVP
jgi:hypothetical protein